MSNRRPPGRRTLPCRHLNASKRVEMGGFNERPRPGKERQTGRVCHEEVMDSVTRQNDELGYLGRIEERREETRRHEPLHKHGFSWSSSPSFTYWKFGGENGGLKNYHLEREDCLGRRLDRHHGTRGTFLGMRYLGVTYCRYLPSWVPPVVYLSTEIS